MNILVAGEESTFGMFADVLAGRGITVTYCATTAEVRSLLQGNSYRAVVVDAVLADGEGLETVRQLAREYPLVNCALVSALSPDEFHEATEGLGLFMQLPPFPEEDDAKRLLELLEKIDGLLHS